LEIFTMVFLVSWIILFIFADYCNNIMMDCHCVLISALALNSRHPVQPPLEGDKKHETLKSILK
jgi:hypothetical protein